MVMLGKIIIYLKGEMCMSIFLKLFYKPEEVIESRIGKKLTWDFAVALVIIIGIFLAQLLITFAVANTMMERFGLIHINTNVLAVLILGCNVLVFMLIARIIKFFGHLAGGQATTNDVAIAEIYFLTPVMIVDLIVGSLNTLINLAAEKNIDAFIMTSIVFIIIKIALLLYFSFLQVKVIATVQKLTLGRATISMALFLLIVIRVIIGQVQGIIGTTQPSYREYLIQVQQSRQKADTKAESNAPNSSQGDKMKQAEDKENK